MNGLDELSLVVGGRKKGRVDGRGFEEYMGFGGKYQKGSRPTEKGQVPAGSANGGSAAIGPP